MTAMLPTALEHVASQDQQGFAHTLQAAMTMVPQLREILESLKLRLQKTESLQHSGRFLEAFLAGDASSAGQFPLSLLTGLDALPFEQQITFFEDFCSSGWEKVQQLMQFMPWAAQMMEHTHVVCDGCEASPIRGPRFKCKTLENFDLCGECFTKKKSINNGQCADHEFECIMMPGKGMCGKGMCGKGMFGKGVSGQGMCGKGKGHRKGKRKADDIDREERPCASAGCPFQATWHATHCCHACEKGMKCHGPKCEKRQQSQPEAKMESCFGNYVSFPVEVADGRNLQIEWQRGEDPMVVAARFAQQHGIQHDELVTIIEFIRHAEQVIPPSDKAGTEPAKPKKDVEDEAMTAPVDACKRQRLEQAAKIEPDVEPMKDVGEGATKDAPLEPTKGSKPGPVRFGFPVVLEDGEHIMEWTKGQDLEDVSRSFVQQLGLPEECVPELIEAARRLETPSALQQLKEMGLELDEPILRELLASCDNDAEKVVAMLMQSA